MAGIKGLYGLTVVCIVCSDSRSSNENRSRPINIRLMAAYITYTQTSASNPKRLSKLLDPDSETQQFKFLCYYVY